MTNPALPPNAPSIAQGRYVIVARIGEGGMAGVYRAYDTKLRVWRAVKVLFPEFARRKKIRARFESEAHTMARLEHPNLVRIYDVGDAGELPFIVMELVSGGTLQGWTRRYGAMPPRLALEATSQLARGVIAAHAAGVIHRDIKPQNVLISSNGTCKLTDFGIAHVDDDGRTRTGSVLGTLGYMSPEQRHDAKSVDARADVYSIGATLWHLVTGQDAQDLFLAHGNPALLAAVPEEIRPLVLRCVAYDREARFPDVAALAAALEGPLEAAPELPPGTPDLVLDLTEEEEPITEETAFEEIQAILDASRGDATTDETTRATPGPKAPLPYFMPSADPSARRKAMLEPRRDEGEALPDWIDPDAYETVVAPGAVEEEIGVGVVTSRSTPGLAPEPAAAEPPKPPTPPRAPTREDPSEEAATETDDAHGIRPEVVYEEPAPRPRLPSRPPPPPPPPSEPEPEPSLAQRVLAIAAIPIGLFVAGSTIFVLVLAVLYFLTANGLQDAERLTIERRSQLYLVLRDERSVMDELTQLGASHEKLAEAWLTYSETKSEPDRSRAALAYLDVLEAEARAVNLDRSDAFTRVDAGHTLRKIRAARQAYEDSREAWEAAADSPQGRIVVALGGASAPEP